MMKILGITWGRSVLVTFDPLAGAITEKHAWLNPREDFVGLAYDSNRNKLYALSQVSCNLYSIDPLTRDVKWIGKLDAGSGVDASALSYNPAGDVLYTIVLHGGVSGPFRSDLATVNTDNAHVTVVGKIGDGLCNSLCWRESDGRLNSYIVYGSGSSESPYKASLVTVDPITAAMTAVFETPYHTVMGLAQKPGEDAYVSYVNSDTSFYGNVDLDSHTVTPLGPSNAGVGSAAMLYRDFYVAAAPNLPPCSFSDDDCLGPAE